MNRKELDQYVDKRIKEQKAKRKSEEKEAQKTFDNGGYRVSMAAAAHLAKQVKEKPFDDNLKKDYQNEIALLKKRINNSTVFSQKDKNTLFDTATAHQNFMDVVNEAEKARAQQRQLQEKRDKADNDSAWGKIAATFIALIGGSKEATQSPSTVRQAHDMVKGEKEFSVDNKQKSAELQKQINENYAKYAPFLDREKLKKSLHDGSLSGKDLKYAKEDYQAADEYKKAELAAKALEKNKDIEKYVKHDCKRVAGKSGSSAFRIW